MPITSIKTDEIGLAGVYPRIVYIDTTDSLDTILATGYLNQMVRFHQFDFSEKDMCLVTSQTSAGRVYQVGWFEVSITGQDYSLIALDDNQTGGLINVTTLDSGAGTFTLNASTNSIYAILVGAGGGGGGSGVSTGGASAGGGGGAGARIDIFIDSPASSYAYSVGAGGAGGSNSAGNGVDGGDTVFGGFTSPGGGGGKGGTAILANAPKKSGNVAFGGYPSASPGTVLTLEGGAGSEGIVFDISANALAKIGVGGQTPGFGGSYKFEYIDSNTTPTSGAGDPGISPGSGGNGSWSIDTGFGQYGGAGRDGIIIINEYA